MCITSLLSVTSAVGFKALLILWVCVCVCVFVCVQLISLLLKALGVSFSSWSTSTWGCNMHFTSLLSVTPAVGFKALLIILLCVCVCVCVFVCVKLISLLLRALVVFF